MKQDPGEFRSADSACLNADGKPANKKSRGDLKSLEVDFGYKYPGRLYLAV